MRHKKKKIKTTGARSNVPRPRYGDHYGQLEPLLMRGPHLRSQKRQTGHILLGQARVEILPVEDVASGIGCLLTRDNGRELLEGVAAEHCA